MVAAAIAGCGSDAGRDHDCTVRVASEDGEGSNLTGDYQRTRIDVHLDSGKVVGVQIG